MTMSLIALFIFGGSVGLLSGLLGIGGGVVLVPGLMFLFGLSQTEAQGTSLTVLSLPIAGFAAAIYYQNGHVHAPIVGMIAAGFLIGAFGGAKLVPHVPVTTLRVCFAGLLFYVAFVMALDARPVKSQAALPAFLGAVLSLIVARLLHRKWTQQVLVPPPDSHTEYHI